MTNQSLHHHRYVLSIVFLLTIGIVSVISVPDFTVSNDVELIVLSADANEWSLDVKYKNFFAGSDGVSFDVSLLDYETCSTAVPDGLVNVGLDPMVNNDESSISLPLTVNVAAVQADPSLWNVNPDTAGELTLCVSLSILYGGEMVNHLKTKTKLTVQNQDGTFAAFDGLTTHMQASSMSGAEQTISLGYPVRSYPCDTNSQEIVYQEDNPPEPLSPGMAVRFCVALKEPMTGVHVQRMGSISYSSGVDGSSLETKMITNEQGETLTNLAEVDCTLLDGVCQVAFIPLANYFLESDAASIKCTGSAVLAFGSDTDTRLREYGGSTRRLQQGELDGSGLSESSFEYLIRLDNGSAETDGAQPWSTALELQDDTTATCVFGGLSNYLAMGITFLLGVLLVASYRQCIHVLRLWGIGSKKEKEDKKIFSDASESARCNEEAIDASPVVPALVESSSASREHGRNEWC